MGKKPKVQVAEKAPVVEPQGRTDENASDATKDEPPEVSSAKARAKALEGSVFGSEAARLRRELFGAE